MNLDNGLEKFKSAAECLKVLAHPVRLQMLEVMLNHQLSVGEIAKICQVRPHVASEHLRLMQRCGFLKSEKKSRTVYYEICEPYLKDILNCIQKRFGEEN